MKRFPPGESKPIPDKEPEVTTHLRAMTQDGIDGTTHADDYTPEAWKLVLPQQKEIQASLKHLGDFVSLTLVDRGAMGRPASEREIRDQSPHLRG